MTTHRSHVKVPILPEPVATYGLRLLFMLALAMLLTTGCGPQSNQQSAPSTTTAPTSAATATLPVQEVSTPPSVASAPGPTSAPSLTTTVVVGQGEFVNPVIQSDFPDPGVILVDGTYYAYATNSAGKNIQVAKSSNLVDWTMLSDGLPVLPTWAATEFGEVWAPEVIVLSNKYVMYYTAHLKDSGSQCLGVATSDTPEGPFKDTNDKPFICQLEAGGSIDASPFLDAGKLYLYWKNDGNCCGGSTYIYEQELAPDGLSLVGEPKQLLSNDIGWEGAVIEAPTMWKQSGSYYLFFSGNAYNTVNYAIGYATCASPTGPCTDAEENPILKSSIARPPAIGPGHQAVVLDNKGRTWLVYHVWAVPSGGQLDRRFMWLDRITWEDGKPHIKGPTTAPQPEPIGNN